MAAFSHLDPGRPEEAWVSAIAAVVQPALPMRWTDLIVVAAHPDDETLGAGGLLRRLHAAGARITVIIASDGEGSHPASPTTPPPLLARRRREEVAAAVGALAPGAGIRFLGLPDGGLDRNEGALAAAVREAITSSPSTDTLVVAPWEGDRHRDHRVAGAVSRTVAAEHGVAYRGYPIWLWHWGSSGDVPWDDVESLPLAADEVAAKAEAIGAHRSQVAPLSPAAGDETVLSPGMISHFTRDVELFVRPEGEPAGPATPSLPVEYFDDKYTRHRDPWGFDSRWYEERKRRMLLASLPDQRSASVLELGCATGRLTQELATRADSVLAIDAAESALARARERLAAVANVELRRALIPDEWPEGEYDLIVVSEIAYYLSPADLSTVLQRIESALRPGGTVVLCHWRHRVPDYPASGDEVHAAFAARTTLGRLVRHEEEDFLLDVYAGAGAASVARRTGLLP